MRPLGCHGASVALRHAALLWRYVPLSKFKRCAACVSCVSGAMCRVPCSKFVVCHMQWQARMTIYYGADGDALPLCGDERVAKVML